MSLRIHTPIALLLLAWPIQAQSPQDHAPRSARGSGVWQRTNIDVPPVARDEPGKLYPSGEFEPEGFSRMVLSFQGEARSSQKGGRVGVLLIPDEEAILRALREGGTYQFAIELSLDAPAGERYFAAEQIAVPVTFPSFRVYFYNETADRVLVNVYAYLTR